MSMRVIVSGDAVEMGQVAAAAAADALRAAVAAGGRARLLLSTGRSQLTTLEALIREEVPWASVEAFHLDEYVGLPASHPASFRRYLAERFAARVPLAAMCYVDTEGDLADRIRALSEAVRRAPIDVGLVGIGENGHLAFNDPPADFGTSAAFTVVELAESCRRQQVGEGWFERLAQVPQRAITMTVPEILRCRVILSAVPYAVKAEAVRRALSDPVGPDLPATALRTHADATLFLDRESSRLLPPGAAEGASPGA